MTIFYQVGNGKAFFVWGYDTTYGLLYPYECVWIVPGTITE